MTTEIEVKRQKLKRTFSSQEEREAYEFEFFSDMTQGVMLVEGLPGAGKTLFGNSLGWKLRKYFGMPVVMDYHPAEAFGDYLFLGEEDFLKELGKVTEIARESQRLQSGDKIKAKSVAAMEAWMSGKGSILQGAVILLDEGYKYFEKRKPTEQLGLLYGYLVQQWRHYGCLIVVMATSSDLLDRYRLMKYLTHEVNSSFGWGPDGMTAFYKIRNRLTMKTKPMSIYAPTWGELFNSWNPIAMRARWLHLGEREV